MFAWEEDCADWEGFSGTGARGYACTQAATSGKLYQIVGEAYVYGIMDGEMVTAETMWESFDIC